MDAIQVTGRGELFDAVERIYLDSFPECERIPLEHLVGEDSRGRMYAVTDSGETVGLYYTVTYPEFVFLFYLAVAAEHRGRELGGRILEGICEGAGLPVVLNVEEVSDSFGDYEVRRKRLGFYLAHGFSDTGKVLVDEQGTFNVLCRGEFDADAYLRSLNTLGRGTCGYRRAGRRRGLGG